MSNRTSVLARQGVPTLCAALAIWNAREDIPAGKKRRVRQDVLKACKWIGASADELLAHPANLNPRLRRLSPGLVKAGERRIGNVRNSIKTLLRFIDFGSGKSFKATLTPAWQAQSDLIPTRYLRASVQCMMQLGSAKNIPPPDFGDAASDLLLKALNNDQLHGRPRITHQNCIRASNRLRELDIGWAVQLLTPPRYGNAKIKKWSDLPPWCHTLTKAFMARATTDDPYELAKAFKKWRPATSHTYETLLRRFFSAAARITTDFETPRTWEAVANAAFATPVLQTFTNAHNLKKGWVMVSAMASLLGQIAENPGCQNKLTPEEIARYAPVAKELHELAARLYSNRGLSAQNHERVSPFKGEANLARLYLLPFALEKELAKSRLRRRRLALLAQWAVALAILTFAPLRIRTLVLLADRNLKWSRPGRRGELSLELDADMLKSGEPASIPLPPECARLIKLYIDKYRTDLLGKSTTFLFPGDNPGRAKRSGVLSIQIRRLIAKRTDLTVNPHLYRHLVHIVILRRFPGAYVMVSRVLTHRSLDTAVRNYAYFDVELSMRAYQRLVQEVQTGTRASKIDNPEQIAQSHSEYTHGSR